MWQQQSELALAVRQLALEALEQFNDEYPRHAGTAWAVFNAATETSDWRKGRGDNRESILRGNREREKTRAYEALVPVLV